MTQPVSDTLKTLVEAALPHVAFDGWTLASFRAAVEDSGIDPALAATEAPRGALDLAVAFHRMGDAAMVEQLGAMDLSQMRFRDRVATAVRLRLEVADDREAVRRGTTLFALPQNAPLGAQLIWGTADAIWTALGDTSDDLNWYTKRCTLSGVYSATVLYWLGDESPEHADTWAFLDRRIDEVMQIEKLKAKMRDTPVLKQFADLPNQIFAKVRAPGMRRTDVPGQWPVTPGNGQ